MKQKSESLSSAQEAGLMIDSAGSTSAFNAFSTSLELEVEYWVWTEARAGPFYGTAGFKALVFIGVDTLFLHDVHAHNMFTLVVTF